MAFMISQAIESILPVLDALLAVRSELSGTTRQRVEALVSQHGPAVAAVSSYDVGTRIALFLDDLAAMGSALPAQVIATLQAGLRRPVRGPESTAPGLRQAILDRLVLLYDFRAFDNPDGLADEVTGLVSANLARLTPDERAAWGGLVAAYESTHDADALLRGAERLLRDYPLVRRLLESRKRAAPAETYRGPGASVVVDEAFRAPEAGPGEEGAGETAQEVARYANVFFPAQVLVTQRNIPLVVDIGAEYHEGARGGASEVRITLLAGELRIVLRAAGFQLVRAIGGRPVQGAPAVRVVDVKADRDCEPVVYFLSPLATGRHTLALDFYQANDRPILGLAFETEVVAEVSALTNLLAAPVDAAPLLAPARGAAAPPPDLELRVTLSGTVLSYHLNSPGGSPFNHLEVGRVDLLVDPLTFLKPTFDALNTLAKQPWDALNDDQRRRAQSALDDIGHDLWRQLFPEDEAAGFRKAYRDIRERYRGRCPCPSYARTGG